MIRVTLPDGSAVDVETDDPQAAAQAAKKYLDRSSQPSAADSPSGQFSAANPAPGSYPAPPDSATGRQWFEGPVAAAPARPGRTQRAGLQGVARGGADAVGTLPDLANMPFNLLFAGADKASQFLGGPAVPFRLGSVAEGVAGAVSDAAKRLGIDVMDPEAMSFRERMAYNVNRFGTQAATGAGVLAPLAAARSAARVGDISRSTALGKPPTAEPQIGEYLLRPYQAANIGRTVIGDAAAGAGAGAALTGVESTPYLKDSVVAHTLAPMVGGMGGAMATEAGRVGAIAAGRAAGRPFGFHLDKSVVDPATGLPYTRKATDAAARTLQNEAAEPTEIAGRVRANQAVLGDYLKEGPTTLQMSEDPGLARLDKQIGDTAGGKELVRQRRFQSSVRDTLDATVPPGSRPEALQEAAQREADRRTGEAAARTALVERRAGQVEDIRQAQAAPLVDVRGERPAASAALHERVVGERPTETTPGSGYLRARAEKNAAFEAIDPDRTVQVDAAPIIAAAERVRAGLNQLGPQREQLPAEFVRRIERLAPRMVDDPEAPYPGMAEVNVGGPGTAALGDLVDVRKYMSTAYEKARAAGNFDLADNIAELRRAINRVVTEAPEGAAANQQYREFAGQYRTPGEMGRFTRDIDRGKEVPPSQTAGRFLQPERPEKSADLQRVIANDPGARQNTAQYLMAGLAESALRPDGTLDPVRATRWAERNAHNLAAVAPEMRDQVNALIASAQKGERVAGAAAERVRAAQGAERRTQAEIDRGALGMVLDADPKRAVYGVMSDATRPEQLMDELVRLTEGNPNARNGLKAAVHEYIVDKATNETKERMRPGDGRGPVSPAKLSALLDAHGPALARVFTPEEMNGLRAGYKALDLANIEKLRTGTGSDTFEKVQMFDKLIQSPIGKGLDAALRLKFGMLKGGGFSAVLRRQMAGITDNSRNEVLRILEQARKDPELLILLAGRKLPVGSPAWNSALGRIMGYGEGARELTERDDAAR